MATDLWPAVFVLALLLLLILGLSACVWRVNKPWLPWLALGLLAWLGAVACLAWQGLLAPSPPSPIPVCLTVALPLLLGAWALTSWKALQRVALQVPLSWLVALHFVRVVGGIFLVYGADGRLPQLFAQQAGWGDLLVALSAPWVAWQLHRGRPHANAWAWVWSVIGIVDFVGAMAIGVLSSSSPLRVFTAGPSTDLLARLPLSLIPTFGVPVLALVYGIILARLLGPRPLD